jgi:hypothetical protein
MFLTWKCCSLLAVCATFRAPRVYLRFITRGHLIQASVFFCVLYCARSFSTLCEIYRLLKKLYNCSYSDIVMEHIFDAL